MLQTASGINQVSSTWSRVWRVFFEPFEVMESLTVQWKWVPAWVSAVVITLLLQIPAIINYTHFINGAVSAGQIDAELASSQKWMTILSNAMNPPVQYLGMALICGAVMAFVSALNSSAFQGFGRHFSAATWAVLPPATGTALFKAALEVLYHGPARLMFSGPALLLAQDTHGLLKSFLVTLDIFNLWFLGLCVLAMYVLSKRRYLPAAITGALIFVGSFGLNYLSWH